MVLGRPGRTSRQGAIQVAARVRATMGKRKEIGNTDGRKPTEMSFVTNCSREDLRGGVTPLTNDEDEVARNLRDLGYIQKSKAGVGIFPATSIKQIFVG